MCETFRLFETKPDLRNQLQALAELPGRNLTESLMGLDKQNPDGHEEALA